MKHMERREILRLFGSCGVVFASGLVACAGPHAPPNSAPNPSGGPPGRRSPALEDLFFLQLSDTHWGFSGPPNPEADTTLKDTIKQINAAPVQPDFLIFTGDLTHTTDDPAVRRARMTEFKTIVAELRVKSVRFIPGEHDAALDRGQAFREHFGDTHYAFDHKGVHFIALDNVSDPASLLGDEQLAWLEQDVSRIDSATPIVVFAHRPLFDLYPSWDWMTKDGARALEILSRHPQVTVFYGHIHQLHEQTTGHIRHHAARSLIFPLPAPGSVPKKAPLAWDAQSSDHGIGYRVIENAGPEPRIVERKAHEI
jgi:hypothetical protein